MTTEKPLPVPTPVTRPFWDALREHRVRIQHCAGCERWVYYPRSHCPGCLSPTLEWRDISGEGTVYTFTVARAPTAPQFLDELPQKIAVVELDEGPKLTTTLVNIEPEAIRIGMRVRPVYDDVEGAEVTLLRYEPV
ncbi:MAG: acyl dehydratase [Dehalococcoidia bacterium]|nr:acyl dehydratase [Dehalococcoidia bacterium]